MDQTIKITAIPTLNEKFNYCWYLILGILAFFSFYFAIGAYPLLDNNEGLYASIGKFMLLHREFVIPHLNCVPYIEKPPLLYWLLSASFSLFGFTAFAARFVTVTSAILTVLALIIFSKKIKLAPLGLVSALIFVSSLGISIIARMVYFDMLFTLLLSATLLSLFYWNDSQKISALRFSYLCFGLSILTKGLVALILIPGSFLLFLILTKNLRAITKLFDPLAMGIFLAAVLPWHLVANIQHPGFLNHYIIEEHFLRFLNLREPHDYYNGPIYYYLPRIIIYIFPWSLFLPLIFWRTKDLDATEHKLIIFSWCWFLVPLIFFSLSSAKANYYLVVSMPALAILLGSKIIKLTINSPKTFKIWSAINLLITACILIFSYRYFPHKLVLTMAAFSLVFGITILFLKRYPMVILTLIASMIIPGILVMLAYIQTNKNILSTEAAGTFLTGKAQTQPIYLYQDFENISALAFYAPDCFKIIDSASPDLYYGKNLPNYKPNFVSSNEFKTIKLDQPVYVVVPNQKLKQFYETMKPIHFTQAKAFDRVTIILKK